MSTEAVRGAPLDGPRGRRAGCALYGRYFGSPYPRWTGPADGGPAARGAPGAEYSRVGRGIPINGAGAVAWRPCMAQVVYA